MSTLAVLLLLLAATTDNTKLPGPYTAVESVTIEGKTSRTNTYFDGVHRKSASEDGKSGFYRDESLKTTWQWNPAYGCIHVTDTATGVKPDVHEEALGSETIAGHPTRKVRKTDKWTEDKGKVNTYSSTI